MRFTFQDFSKNPLINVFLISYPRVYQNSESHTFLLNTFTETHKKISNMIMYMY